MSSTGEWTCILFDVDGTLVDSAPQVTRAFKEALVSIGEPCPTDDRLRRYVGPPLWWSFSDLGYEGDLLTELVETYRRIYHRSFLEPLPFPGIGELLHGLHADSVPLATATSKQLYMAREQLDHLGLLPCFDVVAGATPGPGSTKATVIADALAQLEALGHDVSRPVLVGDSIWDVQGGAEAGIEVIGVTWGYSFPGDLDSCVRVVDAPHELRRLVAG